ncbi:MAG: diacylglycerol kinase family lipid kinase [Armatimonadetes bacterium]|nr:diacylglycerol kinase family lipid kinase [Armatimonadota bacterium]
MRGFEAFRGIFAASAPIVQAVEAVRPRARARRKARHPIQAILIHNRRAGGATAFMEAEAAAILRTLGYDPVYHSTDSEDDLDVLLPQVDGLVVPIGGDGTVRAVVSRLVRLGLHHPVTILPAGTANNVARQLGIEGDLFALLRGLEHPHRVRFDVGRARGPWGTEFFLEAAGFGLFADSLEKYLPEEGKQPLKAIRAAVEVLSDTRTYPVRLSLDGREKTGRFLLVEALNTGTLGPRLPLRPAAESGDGLLDVFQIDAEQRESLLRYFTEMLTGGDLEELAGVTVDRVEKVEVQASDSLPLHLDAEVRWIEAGERVVFDLLPSRLEFWVPRQ